MHKICLCCGKVAKSTDAHCGNCGEASWQAMNDFPMTEPALLPVVEDKPRRGRK